ncbi:MAG TPA: YdeI/OmpD-associated family protein [Solirubrobacteraceae bacterium]
MSPKSDLPTIEFRDPEAWERWLHEHHTSSPGVWVKIAKKGAPTPTVNHPQALEEAIRYGWIDGQKAGHDEHHWLQRFTPRGPRSKWSQVNRDKALELIAAGRMMPAGLEQFEAAKRDGRIDDAYEPQSRATVPDDFQQALDADPAAAEFFATLKGANRYAFLYRLHHVKKPDARAKRISMYIGMLGAGKTFH